MDDWTIEIVKELKKKPLKKDSYDLEVKIIKVGETNGQSHCCHRKPFKLIAFVHKDNRRRRITKFIAVCKTHFNLLSNGF